MLTNVQLEQVLNQLLEPHLFRDYCPNGLQVEGRHEIQRIVTGVTASKDLIEAAIAHNADALLVHHGYFWKGEQAPITGIKQRRIKRLLGSDLNLYAYHLPLDAHPLLGNNIQLAYLLGIESLGGLDPFERNPIVLQGNFREPLTVSQLATRIKNVLGRTPLVCDDTGPDVINTVAWCSGGGQNFIEQAMLAGCDAFISGEVSEQTIHIAREGGIHFFSAGHHATERYGIKALGEWLQQQQGLDVSFIDIDNPV